MSGAKRAWYAVGEAREIRKVGHISMQSAEKSGEGMTGRQNGPCCRAALCPCFGTSGQGAVSGTLYIMLKDEARLVFRMLPDMKRTPQEARS